MEPLPYTKPLNGAGTNNDLSSFCKITDLNVAFHGRKVLHNLNLSLPDSGITVIVGPSGSGKTTLLRALNRLNEHFPGYSGSGQINMSFSDTYQDINHSHMDLAALRRLVGMVFQSPNVLPTSIVRNIDLPLKLVTSMDKGARQERMVRALQEVHLWDEVRDRLKDSAQHLSGGQQQRLCLARVLALRPKILLLDEPTASLDFKTAQRIEDLLLELKQQYPIIAVSHSLQQTRRIADRIVVMKNGQVERQLDKPQCDDLEHLQLLLVQVF